MPEVQKKLFDIMAKKPKHKGIIPNIKAKKIEPVQKLIAALLSQSKIIGTFEIIYKNENIKKVYLGL